MTDIVDFAESYLRANAAETGADVLIDELVKEVDKLRGLLRHADDVVIWEGTRARAGFQEEIEGALGIGAPEQKGNQT